MIISNAFLVACASVTAVASVYDIRTGKIPNWLTLGSGVLAVALHGIASAVLLNANEGLFSGLSSLFGAFACGVSPYVAYRLGLMGGGDVKLLASIGATLGPMVGIEAVFYGTVVAGFYALARLAYRGVLFRNLFRSLISTAKFVRSPEVPFAVPLDLRARLRFAPAAFVGVLLAFATHWRLS